MQQTINEEEEELKDFMKNVVSLMNVNDLAGALVLKTFAGKNKHLKNIKIVGIPYLNSTFEVAIRKIGVEE